MGSRVRTSPYRPLHGNARIAPRRPSLLLAPQLGGCRCNRPVRLIRLVRFPLEFFWSIETLDYVFSCRALRVVSCRPLRLSWYAGRNVLAVGSLTTPNLLSHQDPWIFVLAPAFPGNFWAVDRAEAGVYGVCGLGCLMCFFFVGGVPAANGECPAFEGLGGSWVRWVGNNEGQL